MAHALPPMYYMKKLLGIAALLAFIMTHKNALANQPDTLLHVTMDTVLVTAERAWANDTVRYRYNQTKYYVTTILPYVKDAVRMYDELEAKTSAGLSRKERRAFVKEKEAELKQRFEAEVKELNETQGVLLVKLVARQTGMNIYDMLQEYKGVVAATKWLAWGRLNGFNISRKYNPDSEVMLENIMEELGYPLPEFYPPRLIITAN